MSGSVTLNIILTADDMYLLQRQVADHQKKEMVSHVTVHHSSQSVMDAAKKIVDRELAQERTPNTTVQ